MTEISKIRKDWMLNNIPNRYVTLSAIANEYKAYFKSVSMRIKEQRLRILHNELKFARERIKTTAEKSSDFQITKRKGRILIKSL